MAHETAGDPRSGLKWTRRTTAKLADRLRTLDIDVCPRTVARLLKAMGYSLRVNHKKRAGAAHPNRNAQFRAHHRTAPALCPRSSASIPRRRNWSACSAIPAPSGTAAPNWSTTTTFAPTPRASPSPTASTTPAPMPAPSSSARPPTPPRSPSTASRSGGCRCPAGPGRWRRQQQLHRARLEVQPPTAPLQSARPARDRGALPAGHVEMESHRTPPVLRDQQELGGPPPGQLRDHPEIPADHTHRQARDR